MKPVEKPELQNTPPTRVRNDVPPLSHHQPGLLQPTASTEIPRATEIPRTTETLRATDVPRATEIPRAAEIPRATETPRATDVPRADVPTCVATHSYTAIRSDEHDLM